jgi:RNA polymerase sigma-70 factor (ECF subfamily)
MASLMPDEAEVRGLLGLMLLHHARREARFSGDDLVLLEDQDRSLWNAEEVTAGRAALQKAFALGEAGQYTLQAAIASLQCDQPVDWSEVAALYGQLAALTHSPVVELNRAVAIAQGGEVERALELVDQLDLDSYQYLHSSRGELLRRLGRLQEARAAYERAFELATSEPERRFLSRRIAEL